MPNQKLAGLYSRLALAAKNDLKGADTRTALREIIAESMSVVSGTSITPLQSNVAGKRYGMARLGSRTSRPINTDLFDKNVSLSSLFAIVDGTASSMNNLDWALYTVAMSYPLAADLTKDGDKKSPGTFFEHLVGHIFAVKFQTNPTRRVIVPTLGKEVSIPTDYVFELANDRRIHLPIKISTRERVVQVWAHQKLLDGMHGHGRFRGLLVCLTETNKQQDTSVTEVCLPHQWAAYQMYVAQLHRVYYFDPPERYISLRNTYPNIQVWPFSKFFNEAQSLI